MTVTSVRGPGGRETCYGIFKMGLHIVCLAAKTKDLSLGGLDCRHCFLTVLEAEVSDQGAALALMRQRLSRHVLTYGESPGVC